MNTTDKVNDILSEKYESLVVYDTEKEKEIATITHDCVTTANSNVEVRLNPNKHTDT